MKKPVSSTARVQDSSEQRKLPQWLTSRLTSYTTAAGLGAFGFAQSSEGAIVFTDVPDATITQGGTLYINFDSFGYNEFAVAAHSNSVRVNPYNIGPQQSKVLTSGNYYVNSFNPGDLIGPGSPEVPTGAARFAGRQSGPYFYSFVGTDKYVGLKWDIGGGNFRYGWARLDVTSPNQGTATLFSYAYESEANTPIAAGAGAVPEPASLALLAAGGGALALKRRRRAS
jgi:hypothetical protein